MLATPETNGLLEAPEKSSKVCRVLSVFVGGGRGGKLCLCINGCGKRMKNRMGVGFNFILCAEASGFFLGGEGKESLSGASQWGLE